MYLYNTGGTFWAYINVSLTFFLSIFFRSVGMHVFLKIDLIGTYFKIIKIVKIVSLPSF